jgi:NadR type nicotinamide-nucleotide adenylyltransferase
LCIGKFYPPHRGHHLLVRTASALSERVTVIAMAAACESIALDRRVAWLREVHAADGNVQILGVRDDYPVDYDSDEIWRAHVGLMVEALRPLGGAPVDAVFTSEPYGPELARRLGARSVSVDPAREIAAISGTEVRRDPARAWDMLAPPVRGGLCKRVVVLGAESTGKTTLVAALAARLRARGGSLGLTRTVAEYGRDYTCELLARARSLAQLEGRPIPSLEMLRWPTEAFALIAAEQNRIEDFEARLGGPVLVCDTDAFATGVWHERYVGHRSPAVESLGRMHDFYLLTHADDAPFVQDGLRDGEHIRHWMTEVFVARLTETGRRWTWIRGNGEARLDAAEQAVAGLLAEGWRLADPLG